MVKSNPAVESKKIAENLKPNDWKQIYFPVVESKKFFKILNPAVKDKSWWQILKPTVESKKLYFLSGWTNKKFTKVEKNVDENITTLAVEQILNLCKKVNFLF